MTPTRTYVEMLDPSALRAGPAAPAAARIEQVTGCPASFWRYLYTEVGRAYRWTDRLVWTDGDVRAYLDDPRVSLFLLSVSAAPAGYFELRRDADGGVEIVYFGVLPEFTGRGLGKWMLGEAVGRAWAMGARRVWLHTNTFDHPAALPNYLKRGFTIVRTEPLTG
jgi:GNAT superfamily N-acetyltransferase